MNISYADLSMRNAYNKGARDSSEYIRILAREGDDFRIEQYGRTRRATMAMILQMVACGHAFVNISFMKPYMRY